MKRSTPPLLNSTEDRSRLWRNFAESLRSYPLIGIGFCLWWTWIILIYQSTSILPSLNEGVLLVPGSIGPLAVIAVTLLSVAALYYRGRFTLKGPAYFVLIAVGMTLGGLLTVLWRMIALDAGALGLALYALSSLAIGCSSAFMYIEYNRAFGWLGMLKTLFFSIVSLLCSTCVITALSFAPAFALYAFFIASPGLMTLMLYRTVRAKFPLRAYAEHGNEAELYVPVKFIATSFTEGLSFGIMFGGLVVDGSLVLYPGVTLAGHLLTVALLIASTFFFKLDFNRLIYQIGFPLMALGFLLISCLPGTLTAGGIVQHIGFGFIDLVLWGLGSYLIKNAGLPAIWITACPSGALFAGLSLGSVIGSFVIQGLDGAALQGFASVYAFSIVLVALFLSNNKNLEYGWGTIRPGTSSAQDDSLRRCCTYLANEHALTRREGDVLLLLAQGKSRKAVAQELYVSENTVKTHVRNAYRKLFVQSHEDLLELIERTKAMLEADEGDGESGRAGAGASAGESGRPRP